MIRRFRKSWAKAFGVLGRFYCRHKALEDVIQLLPYGSTGFDHFLRKFATRYELMQHMKDGEDCIIRTAEIDQRIMLAVRSMKHPLTLDNRRDCYRDVLAGASERETLLVGTALELLNTDSAIPQYGNPSVDVTVSDDCRHVAFVADGASLVVHNASLLWDCNCRDPYPLGYKRKPCPIHSQPGAEVISHAFGHGLVRINYDGVSVFWRQLKDLWPPSVDAFHMVRHLNEDGYTRLEARRVCDLGCGTGFLGIWASIKNRRHRHVTFADWLLSPLFLTHGNVANARPQFAATPHFRLGLHTDWVNDKSALRERNFDVLICNPPYLPVLEGHERLLYDSTVAGTELLEYVIEHSEELATRIFISFSSVAKPEVKIALAKTKKSLRLVGKVESVPFRVSHAFDSAGYTNALYAANRLEFRTNAVHPFWHKVATFEILNNDGDQSG